MRRDGIPLAGGRALTYPATVEAAKRIGRGLLVSVGYVAAAQVLRSETWVNAVLWGLALGLSSSGLYSGTKRVAEG